MGREVEFHFKLPKDIADQVDKAAELCGLNRTAFIRNATLAEVAEVQDARRKKRLKPAKASFRVERAADMDDDEAAPTVEEAPAGLGLSNLLAPVTPREAPAVVTPQVDPISRLADAIVSRLEKKPGEPSTTEPEKKKDSIGILFEKLAGLLP